jgi:hypothetical protein
VRMKGLPTTLLYAGGILAFAHGVALAQELNLKKLDDAQLSKVAGGQVVVQSNGVPVLSASPGTPNSGFGPTGPTSGAFQNPSMGGPGMSSASMGLMPEMGQLVGATSFARYGQ